MELDRLKECALFCRVPDHLLIRISHSAQNICIPKGETVYDRHRFQRCLGLVAEGTIQVKRDHLLMSVLQSGDIFGAAALFSSRSDYPTTLVALSDCRILLIAEEQLRMLMGECPQFAENYVIYLSERIQFLSSRLDTLSAGTAEAKLGQYLLSASDHSGTVILSATQLSAQIGVGRASLYRAFETLEQSGAIAREGKTIRILCRDKLHH